MSPRILEVEPPKVVELEKPLRGNVLLAPKPQEPAPLEKQVSPPPKLIVILASDAVYSLIQVRHDVITIKDDLLVGPRDGLPGGLDIRLPHVHGHARKLFKLRRGKAPEVARQALLASAVGHVLHRPEAPIVHQRLGSVPLGKRLLLPPYPGGKGGG